MAISTFIQRMESSIPLAESPNEKLLRTLSETFGKMLEAGQNCNRSAVSHLSSEMAALSFQFDRVFGEGEAYQVSPDDTL